MTKMTWKSAAGWTRIAAAVGLVLLAGRLAFVSGGAAMAKTDSPSPAPRPASSTHRGSDRVEASAAPSASVAPPLPPGTPTRVKLIVMAGPDRSDVSVDQANLGKTPFIGDMSCRAGEVVHIHLTPPQGNALDFERACLPGTIRVEGP